MDFHARMYELFPDWDGKITSPKDIVPVMESEWNCPFFFAWHPGRAPREQIAMRERQEIEAREDRRDSEMRAREDRRDIEQKVWQRSVRNEERVWHVAELVVLGLVVAVASIAAGAVSRGWVPTWWPIH